MKRGTRAAGPYLAVGILLVAGVLATATAQTPSEEGASLSLRSAEPDVRVRNLEGNRLRLPEGSDTPVVVLPGYESSSEGASLSLRSAEPDVRLRNLEGNRPRLPEGGAPVVPPGHESFAPRGAERIQFQLQAVDLAGATIYFPEELLVVFESRYGTIVSLAEVYELAGEVQRRYRDDGYILSRIIVPPQRIVSGRVRIEVIEGYIDSVVVEGAVGSVERLIRAYLDPVTVERPLKLDTLERGLLLANDLPGIEVKGVLQASEDAIGASRLVLVTSRKRFDGLVLVDNIGSTLTGEWEVALRAGANSLTRFGESIAITGLVSDPTEGFGGDRKNQQVGVFGSSMRIGRRGTYLSGLLSYGNSNPGGSLSNFNYDSTKLLASLKVVHPIIRSRSRNLFLEGGFDFIDNKTDIFDGRSFIDDHLRVLSLALAYDLRDRWGGSSYLNLGLRQGLSGLGATKKGERTASRPDADGEFTSIQLTASRLQTLTDTLGLYGLVRAQYAFDPVLSDEEFNLGGIDFGRGYGPSELGGDEGIGATLELQYTKPSSWSFLERYQLFGFYDFGAVRQKASRSVSATEESLASAGIGFRGWLSRGLSVELQVAKPLTRASQRSDGEKDTEFLMRTITRF